MGIRSKLIIVLLMLGFAPMLALSVWLHARSVGAVDFQVRQTLENSQLGIAQEIEDTLREREQAIMSFVNSSSIRDFVSKRTSAASGTGVTQNANDNRIGQALPADLRQIVRGFLMSCLKCYTSVSLFNSFGKPVFRAEPAYGDYNIPNKPTFGVRFQTEDFLVSAFSPDPRVLTSVDQTPIRAAFSTTASGAVLRYSIPVFADPGAPGASRDVLVIELDGDVLLDEVMPGQTESSSQGFIIVLDREGYILYHTNEALRYQAANTVLPAFKAVSDAMVAQGSGLTFYNSDRTKWLVAYRPVASLDISMGVARNYTEALASIKRWGWITILLSGLFGLVTVGVLAQMLRSTSRSIERVTEGAVAIAGGKLDQRIDVRSSDETHLLAESFNIMTDRLRERIARETETRQFESFVRLSAMLTHDLKNAIAGLSLLVGNMKKQFHREEFRDDAMESLTDATNKLRRLVTKLSEPVESLSGEHKLSRSVDLIPIIRRALAANVESANDLHEVDVRLPDQLNTTVDADRIEKVFDNLIINALEAMGSNSGKLTIEAGEMPDGFVFITVSDTGPGMSEEFQRTKLFRPFATTKKTGVGLGLYTCNEVVIAHGGHIVVDSKRGSGATFRVVLPSEPKITRSY